ncbi:MAG: GNAT family N-acetyltransferase [Myxococcales bacterium]|nr:GNAT family N-acetyltransferase [Myxococcales bacterium]
MEIRPDDLQGSEIRALIRVHLEAAARESPACSVHALDVDGLRDPGVTFWSAWAGDQLLGCGALKQLDPRHGEIKSMHTAAAHRGQGVGARMLAHLIEQARRRGYRRLSLETGSSKTYTDMFAPARALYARAGFVECPPFGDYALDPFSTFMMLELPTDDAVARPG